MHLLSAPDYSTGTILPQATVDTKSHEIPPSRHYSTPSNGCWAACTRSCSSPTLNTFGLQKWIRAEGLIKNQVTAARPR
jgi:hypothetical protein